MSEIRISRDTDKIGVICRGGPVNGPYSIAALATLKRELVQRDLSIYHLYGNSAAAPSAVLSAIGQDQLGCAIWATLRPEDLILPPNGWWGGMRTVWNLLNAEAIFDDSPLEQLIKDIAPLDKVFGADAIPIKVPAVDFLTGREVVASNKDPRHRWNFHNCVLGSMALLPFLKCQIIYDVVEAGLLAEPWTREGPFADIAVLFDGGFADNLMLDLACRDGCTVVFIIDILGMALGPLVTHRWNHWSQALQRAFSVLVQTNDLRRFHGVQRTNEVLTIRHDLQRLCAHEGMSDPIRNKLDDIIARMDETLKLEGKRPVRTVSVEDRENSRAFDFAKFSHDEVVHLLHSGYQAAQRVMADVKAV